jgi:hypothetical protein
MSWGDGTRSGVRMPRNRQGAKPGPHVTVKSDRLPCGALEAANSTSILFKEYRELVTEEQKEEGIGIVPKDAVGERLRV